MDETVKHLLSERRIRDNWYIIRDGEMELEPLTTEHMTISKYHERLWFQRLRDQTKEQLLERYYYLARTIDRIESSIEEAKRENYQHMVAVEELHNSMTGLKNIDFGTTQLIQTTLF